MSAPQGFPPGQNPPPHSRPTQHLPPQGPPPNYGRQQGSPPGFGPQGPHQVPQGPHQGPHQGPPGTQPFAGPATSQRPKWVAGVWVLGLVSLAAVALGLSIDEGGNNAWHTVHAWGALAVLGALLTLTPALGDSIPRQRAWQASACGAGALVLFWVLFVLPDAGSNTSLATTVGVACGVIATWIAPGRDTAGPQSPDQRPHAW